jgi:hypothetical protein
MRVGTSPASSTSSRRSASPSRGELVAKLFAEHYAPIHLVTDPHDSRVGRGTVAIRVVTCPPHAATRICPKAASAEAPDGLDRCQPAGVEQAARGPVNAAAGSGELAPAP